jgi:hypothetical protein
MAVLYQLLPSRDDDAIVARSVAKENARIKSRASCVAGFRAARGPPSPVHYFRFTIYGRIPVRS